jgi:hypothetical protein
MNHQQEKQLVYYVAAHDLALEHKDEHEAKKIRTRVQAKFNLRLLREAGMGQPRVVKT